MYAIQTRSQKLLQNYFTHYKRQSKSKIEYVHLRESNKTPHLKNKISLMILLILCGDVELNPGPINVKGNNDLFLQPSTSTGIYACDNGINRDIRYMRPTYQYPDDSLGSIDEKDNSNDQYFYDSNINLNDLTSLNHNNSTRIKCSICDKFFNSRAIIYHEKGCYIKNKNSNEIYKTVSNSSSLNSSIPSKKKVKCLSNRPTCSYCGKFFKKNGLAIHMSKMHPNIKESSFMKANKVQENERIYLVNKHDKCDLQPNTSEDLDISNSSPTINESYRFLSKSFDVDPSTLTHTNISPWYDRWLKVVQLKKLQYDLPCGSIGDRFVETLAEEISFLVNDQEYSERIICFISVILQRTKMIKKAKEIRRLIERRLDKWNDGCYNELIDEAIRCDKKLKLNSKRTNNNDYMYKNFNRLVQRGKIKEASRMIEKINNGDILNPEDFINDNSEQTVFDVLTDKHPAATIPDNDLLTLPSNMLAIPKLETIEITAEHVEKIARKLHGSGGPGGSTSEQWSDFLLRHGKKSALLRDSIAMLTMKLNGEILEWPKIQALMANRLIAINKYPGIRPIGIGEVLRRILAKCIILATGDDVINTCKTDQLCVGIKSGIEGAIHFMREHYEQNFETKDDWCMIMVDAENAFNKINRIHALWQARIHWPRAARFVFNTYQSGSELIMQGSNKTLYSQEGITQGDPLSMLLYGLATLPLINELKQIPNTNQVWYADDSSCQGSFLNVLSWWKKLQEVGPKYGYHPTLNKTRLITSYKLTKSNQAQIQGMQIVNGSSFLGGFIGSNNEEKQQFLNEKIQTWTQNINSLSDIAKIYPQSAHSVVTKSLQCKWIFIQRVMETEDICYYPLKDAIQTNFFPALFGTNIYTEEHDLLHLPTKRGGIGILDPTSQAKHNFKASKNSSKFIVNSLKLKTDIILEEHEENVILSNKASREEKRVEEDLIFKRTFDNLNERRQKVILRGSDPKAKNGSWLSCIPIKKLNFDLSPQEFRDALALRYGKSPIRLPSICDGCGQNFNTEHALNCRTGGLIIRRHNEVRDAIGNLLDLAWGNCVREPLISEQGSIDVTALKADLACRGVWETQMDALFDIRVIDTDAPSYSALPYEKVLENAEREKKRKYQAATEIRNSSFTPLVTSVDGLIGKEFQTLLRAIAERLSEKWHKPYSLVMNWVRVKTTCATLRATSMCIRRSRKRWRSAREFDDGAGIPFVF